MILKIENLCKSYGTGGVFFKKKKEVLKNVSFSVKKGEIFSIIGESGAGKSSIGKILLGIEKKDSGIIEFLDKPLEERKVEDIQMIFQDPYSSLNPAMKVKNILSEPLKANGERNKFILEEKVDKILKEIGLSMEYKEKYPCELSGGQRQRVVIGAAMILNPKVVVCDEAVASLDLSIQQQILKLIKKFNKEKNTTFIFISHDLGVVYNISDRILVFHKGEVQEINEVHNFFASPKSQYGKELLKGINVYLTENR